VLDVDVDVDAGSTQLGGDPFQVRPRFWLLDECLSAAGLRSEHSQQQQPVVASASHCRGVAQGTGSQRRTIERSEYATEHRRASL
jgi:hypothetical protein